MVVVCFAPGRRGSPAVPVVCARGRSSTRRPPGLLLCVSGPQAAEGPPTPQVYGGGHIQVSSLSFFDNTIQCYSYTNAPGSLYQLALSETIIKDVCICSFIRKSQLTIPEDVRRRIKRVLKDEEELDADIFDSMQAEVRYYIMI